MSEPLEFLPVGLSIAGKTVVIIGGGKVAIQKLATLSRFSASVRVHASVIDDAIKAMPVEWHEASYRPDMLEGAFIVYACTSSREVNERVARDARAAGALVNVADSPRDCDFVSPALWFKEGMCVAVVSDGKNAKRSVSWRNAIKSWGEHDTAALEG